MYLDFLVKVPTVKGKITRRKKSNVVYIEYIGTLDLGGKRLEVHIHEYLPHSNREFFEKKFANSEKRC